jgi:hypothetical protein
MLLSFDVVPEAISEHDDWHTHEHLPERLSIPGFLRGTRWVALHGDPRYLVLYEVAELATLTSPAYLERLNEPSAWTSKMMPHYRRMSRGFCLVTGSFGLGTGHVSVVLRFNPRSGADISLRHWLLQDLLPQLEGKAGIGSGHLLEGAITPQMTNEQRIRGADANVDWALLVTGYREAALADFLRDVVGALEQRAGATVLGSMYRIDYSLARTEVMD